MPCFYDTRNEGVPGSSPGVGLSKAQQMIRFQTGTACTVAGVVGGVVGGFVADDVYSVVKSIF